MIKQHPHIRREKILRAAIRASTEPGGFISLSRTCIAEHAKCSDGLVSRYLGSMDNARRLILAIAIDEEILSIIAQHLVFTGGQANIPVALKRKALNTLSGR